MLDRALEYLKCGLSVVPARPDTKIPYVPWTPYQKRLPTENELRQWFTKDFPKANLGFITGLISGIVVIDIDSEQGREQVSEYIPDSLVHPIAESPRGGEHWYFRCLDADLQTHVGLPGMNKVDVRANEGFIVAPPSIGVNGKSYKWRLNILDTEIPVLPKSLYEFLPKKDVPKSPMIEQASHTVRTAMFNEGSRDNDLFYTACSLVRGKMSHQEIYQVLLKLCLSCNPPMALKMAEQKAMAAIRTAMDQPRDLKAEISQWCLYQDGAFRADQCFRELGIQGKEHLQEARKIISDSVSKGIIEKEKGIDIYRPIDKQIEHIKIPDTMPEPMPLNWPLGISSWANIYPGNVAVIAGTSNAGKRIFCINFARNNMNKYKIRYQSSEMDGQELKMRISGFDNGVNDLINNVEWIRRGSNWWDLILPDAINIIDFMEIYDNFYDAGKWIKQIYDKLKGGIALIAIQKKNAETDDGRGGAFTREKARLYLSMNYGSLKIVKCKNWASDVDPNGMGINFTVERGIILKNLDTWKRCQ